MRILIAPLNWGLGHASRCIPLVQRFLDEGNEVVLGGDGESLTLLRKHFPKLRYVYLAPLNLRYSKGQRQVWAMIKAFPRIVAWAIKDHALLKALLREEHFDQIISDNRFGLYLNHQSSIINHQSSIINHQLDLVYLTHQLWIPLPRGWRWLEPLVARLHARVYRHFDKVWVPDYENIDQSLAGNLSHPIQFKIKNSKFKINYIGPLSRFSLSTVKDQQSTISYETVAVLSGLEPHRTLLEQELIARFSNDQSPIVNHQSSIINHEVLIVQGLPNKPNTRIKRGNITLVPYLSDDELASALLAAKHIIAHSGYSTIMDLHALGLLNHQSSITNHQLELIPTPGQPEQEYLAFWLKKRRLL